ncbi:unnamed protein product [Penicillium roqueforti FM164]|uniref:Genomic scaffold, ProqFM164S03 n=1 Tax=Penicillium roqueforti (strain FM164) TaxID=1365484 RepID=W6QAC2_PENRF|nr:unnamed protein product [Penicillium roqueforti FM164]
MKPDVDKGGKTSTYPRTLKVAPAIWMRVYHILPKPGSIAERVIENDLLRSASMMALGFTSFLARCRIIRKHVKSSVEGHNE